MGPGGGFGHGKLKFDEEEAKPEISKALLLRIVKYFVPYWKQTLLVMTVLCISAVLGLLPPLLIQQIIDRALPDKNLQLLFLLVAASLATTVVSGLLGVLQNYLNSFISQNIVHDMKRDSRSSITCPGNPFSSCPRSLRLIALYAAASACPSSR